MEPLKRVNWTRLANKQGIGTNKESPLPSSGLGWAVDDSNDEKANRRRLTFKFVLVIFHIIVSDR